MRAQVWLLPPEISSTFASAAPEQLAPVHAPVEHTATGESLEVLGPVPSPSCCTLLAPKQRTSLFARSAHVNESPVTSWVTVSSGSSLLALLQMLPFQVMPGLQTLTGRAWSDVRLVPS